ncbi:HASP [Enterospora canceri]|uniref:non-specific serine/threonine protein kinase n=1 Tax=Enterospora canceri TaxID=1081671 RepID=A0A1Y1S8H5_9MICR|nr:HASP [Enterospora canceri]
MSEKTNAKAANNRDNKLAAPNQRLGSASNGLTDEYTEQNFCVKVKKPKKNFVVKTVSASNFNSYVDSSEKSETQVKPVSVKTAGLTAASNRALEKLRENHKSTVLAIEKEHNAKKTERSTNLVIRGNKPVKEIYKKKFLDLKAHHRILTEEYTTIESLKKADREFYTVIQPTEFYRRPNAKFKSTQFKTTSALDVNKAKRYMASLPMISVGPNGEQIRKSSRIPVDNITKFKGTKTRVKVKKPINDKRVIKKSKPTVTNVVVKKQNNRGISGKKMSVASTVMLHNPKGVDASQIVTECEKMNKKVNIVCKMAQSNQPENAFCKMNAINSFEFACMPKSPEKIAEASFSDIFLVNNKDNAFGFEAPDGRLVVKIVPFTEFYTEESFMKECYAMEQLKTIPGICKLHYACVLTGAYSPEYVTAWKNFNKETENTDPSSYSLNQKYGCLFMEHAGVDLESFHFTSASEVLHFLIQFLKVIKNLQIEFKFEHRDLHWGNIMLRRVGSKEVPDGGNIAVSLVDFSLCRFENSEMLLFSDLYHSDSNWIFEGNAGHDYQYEVYRKMMNNVSYWHEYSEKNNLLWIEYVIKKLKVKTSGLGCDALNELLKNSTILAEQIDSVNSLLIAVELQCKMKRLL